MIGSLKKAVPSSFRHRAAVESHLASLPKFKQGSIEVVGSDGALIAVASVSGEETRDQVRDVAADAVSALQRKVLFFVKIKRFLTRG